MKRPGWFFGFLGVLILVWSLTPFWVPRVAHWFLKPEAPAEQGASASQKDEVARVSPRDHAISAQFGAMFGTINSLFSGIALIGVAYGLFLQIEQKRREKQPEVFARLAAKDSERPLVLAPMDDTPGGEVYLTLAVPVYITTGSSAAAFNVEVSVTYGSLAHNTKTLPVPVLSNTDPEDNLVIDLRINANQLDGAVHGWRVGPGNERALGELEVKINFENQQRAKWQITAMYKISIREADSNSLQAWIHKATAATDGARAIELESSAISWTPKEL